MTLSVHTNQSALIALQNLNKTNSSLTDVQNRISTGLKINDAKVVKADIDCGNGVIHVIDTVLLPPSVAKTLAKQSHH